MHLSFYFILFIVPFFFVFLSMLCSRARGGGRKEGGGSRKCEGGTGQTLDIPEEQSASLPK